MLTSKVVLAECRDYEERNLVTALNKIFDASGGVENIVQKGQKVVIKPNLVLAKSNDQDKIALTNAKLLREVVKILLTVCDKDNVTIAESPGGPYNRAFISRAYNVSGITEVAEELGVKLNFDFTVKQISKDVEGERRSFPIMNPVVEADVIINLNRLKTHSLCMMTAAVKNLFGCIPGVEKVEYHSRYPKKDEFAEMLIDLCEVVKSDAVIFNITDAVYVMEGNGPTGGTKRELGLIAGAFNPYALDVVNCELMGFAKDEVLTVAKSVERGYAGDVEVTGEDVEAFKVKDIKRPDTHNMLSNIGKYQKIIDKFLYATPKITKKCIKCGACVGNCPRKVIKKSGKKYKIGSRKDCILCYCCQELCPADAIKTQRSLLLKLMN